MALHLETAQVGAAREAFEALDKVSRVLPYVFHGVHAALWCLTRPNSSTIELPLVVAFVGNPHSLSCAVPCPNPSLALRTIAVTSAPWTLWRPCSVRASPLKKLGASLRTCAKQPFG